MKGTPVNDMIRTERLRIGYNRGVSVYGNINVRAAEGEMISLMGKNGVGKSTLLKTIVRLIPPLDGQVMIDGVPHDAIGRRDFARRVGYVSTGAVSSGNLRVIDVVRLGRYPHTGWFGFMTNSDREAVARAVEWTDLGDLVHKNLWEVSDGERQRVMIARTLAQDTPVILLDEPTAFLDLPRKYEMIHLLKRLAGEQGKCIVFSTQDLNIAIEESDRMWLMLEEGMVEAVPEELILNGQVQKLFGSSSLQLDLNTGQLKLPKPRRIPVRMNGDNELVYWTLRALEKTGCYPAPGNDYYAHITVKRHNGKICWEMKKNGENLLFSSLHELILHVRTAQYHLLTNI